MNFDQIYITLNNSLKSASIGVNASELHGFISGLIAGNNIDKSWEYLIKEMLNDGQSFSAELMTHITALYQKTNTAFENKELRFQMLINDGDLFIRIDDFIGFVNHFLLGLGIAQPKIQNKNKEVRDLILDFKEITLLDYDKNIDANVTSSQFEEVYEYVRMGIIFLYEEFITQHSNTLH